MTNEIIFVCRQNANRSPVLAHILETRAQAVQYEGTILSRGYEVRENISIDSMLNNNLIRVGYGTLVDHRPVQLTADEAVSAGIILAMSPRQALHLKALFPRARDKIHSFPAYATGNPKDLSEFQDPNRAIINTVEPALNAKYKWQAKLAHNLPLPLSRLFLQLAAGGRIDNRDREGIDSFMYDLVLEADMYASRAVPRLARDGYLTRPKF